MLNNSFFKKKDKDLKNKWTLYKDRQHESFTKVKPKHCDCPLVAGREIGNKPLPSVLLDGTDGTRAELKTTFFPKMVLGNSYH